LVIHEKDGAYTPVAQRILRSGRALTL
jgi:hypothetical protein